jgi:hypothetical protein
MSSTEPEAEIEWLAGSTPELSDRERLLVDNARREGYAAGEWHGYRVGGEDAVRSMTQLVTFLNDRRVAEALATLHYFLKQETDA